MTLFVVVPAHPELQTHKVLTFNQGIHNRDIQEGHPKLYMYWNNTPVKADANHWRKFKPTITSTYTVIMILIKD